MDIDSGAVTADISLPSQPLGMAYDKRHGRLYVGLPRRNEVLLIDVESNTVIARSNDVPEVDDIDLISAAYFNFPPDT